MTEPGCDGAGSSRIAALTRTGVVLMLGALLGAGCARLARPQPPVRAALPRASVGAAAPPVAVGARAMTPAPLPAPPPVPVSPFADAEVSFFVRGFGMVHGELVIVRVCVGADHSVVSSDVVESSGDPQFDRLAVVWARQVRLRTASAQGAPVAPCGAVRVEMRRAPDTPETPVTGAHENLLG
ncbi:MAG TPA: hypothetical protein VHX52_13250 [Steroidobacteraceae bacterium]|nr:hypothetical protein [Steroidobacteraceae bacterium]